jgi:hypothetical protein
LLIKGGANVNQADNDDRTPLLAAVQMSCIPVIEILIANGADVNSKNNYGETALSISAKRGKEEIVKILLVNGANISEIPNNMVFKPEIEELLEKWPHTMGLLGLQDAYRQVDYESMKDLSEFVGPRNLGGKSKLGTKRRKTTKRPKTHKKSHKKRTKM